MYKLKIKSFYFYSWCLCVVCRAAATHRFYKWQVLPNFNHDNVIHAGVSLRFSVTAWTLRDIRRSTRYNIRFNLLYNILDRQLHIRSKHVRTTIWGKKLFFSNLYIIDSCAFSSAILCNIATCSIVVIEYSSSSVRVGCCSTTTLCSKKVTPKFKSPSLRHILSEWNNILLAAVIIIFPM